MKTSEVLNKAADLIDQRGHSHGTYVDSNGAVCALGAVRITCGATVIPKFFGGGYTLDMGMANENFDAIRNARRALHHYLRASSHDYDLLSDSIPNWNDRNDKETVVNALRSAALTAEDNDN